MVGGLFVIFDPVSVMGLDLNWLSLTLGLIFAPSFFWVIPSRYFLLVWKIVKGLVKEVGFLYPSGWGGASLLLCSLFFFIAMNNFLGLFPFIFTATSHVSVTLVLSLVFWLSLNVFGWINKTLYMFAHLVPQGTPIFLVFFMVLVETVSNLIRPITLSVRLAANMIAGHLLIVLLGSVIVLSGVVIFGGLIALTLLFLLEIAVAFIQSYVFMVLVGLYSAEI